MIISNVRSKISSNHGESIAEVLVASLVFALGMILLISMINASFRILTVEEKSYKDFVTEKNAFELLDESEVFGNFYVTISINNGGPSVETLESRVVKVFKRSVSDDVQFYRYEAVDLNSGD